MSFSKPRNCSPEVLVHWDLLFIYLFIYKFPSVWILLLLRKVFWKWHVLYVPVTVHREQSVKKEY